jgi:hypothetical protein
MQNSKTTMLLKNKNNLSKFAILLILIGISSSIIVHFLRNDGSLIENSLSNYATSKYGFIINLGLYSFALADIIIGLMLINYKNWKINLSSLLFFLCSICLITVAIFHGDGNGLIETQNEYIHLTATFILFSTCPIIILLIGQSIKTKWFRIYSYISCIVISIMTIWGIIFTLKNLTTGLLETTFIGILEKSGSLIIALWMILFLYNYRFLKEIEENKKFEAERKKNKKWWQFWI